MKLCWLKLEDVERLEDGRRLLHCSAALSGLDVVGERCLVGILASARVSSFVSHRVNRWLVKSRAYNFSERDCRAVKSR